MSGRHDEVFLQILTEEKNLIRFFDSIFDFLQRRTDFYMVAQTPNDAVGLPPGCAEKIVWESLNRYKITKDENRDNFNSHEMPVVHEEVCETSTHEVIPDCKQKRTVKPDNYNGATYENYSWSQSISDIDVQVTLPDEHNSKDLQVLIQPSHLCVSFKNKIIISGDLHRKIRATETIWSIDKNILQIHIEKQIESWWEQLLTSEPKLDLQDMDCSRPIDELSEDAQAKLEQLRWDAEQKSRGLPTSNEIQKNKLLKKAWDAEGSPFKGLPFEPSLVSLEN